MRIALGFMGLAALAGTALADINAGDAMLLKSWDLTNSGTFVDRVVDPAARYSNVTTFTGFVGFNGGAQNQAGNTITKLNADDISMVAPIANLTKFSFTVGNLNAVAVTARPRVRFYANDGAAGGPGTVIAGFTFNPIAFAANSANIFFTTNLGIALPQNFWAGMTFDDNTGTTGATLAQMNNLGQLLMTPPDVGTSQDVYFGTTAAGSFFANNPAGSFFNFGANPTANFGWEFVPAPASLALLGLGGLVAGRRRR